MAAQVVSARINFLKIIVQIDFPEGSASLGHIFNIVLVCFDSPDGTTRS